MLHWFGKSHKSRGEAMSIISTTIIGLGLALVSLIVVSAPDADGSHFINFLYSGWVLPTLLQTFTLGKVFPLYQQKPLLHFTDFFFSFSHLFFFLFSWNRLLFHVA
jgi:hypothetical protein